MAIQTLRTDAILKIDTAPIKQDAKANGTVSSLDQREVLRNKKDTDHFKANDAAPSFKTHLEKEEHPRPVQEKFLSRENNAAKNLKARNISKDDSDRSDPSQKNSCVKSVETTTKKLLVKSQEETLHRTQPSQNQEKTINQAPPIPQDENGEKTVFSLLSKNILNQENPTTETQFPTEGDSLDASFPLANVAPQETPMPQFVTAQSIPPRSSEGSSDHLVEERAQEMNTQSSRNSTSTTVVMNSSYAPPIPSLQPQEKVPDMLKPEETGSAQTTKTEIENSSFLEITGRSYSSTNIGTPPPNPTNFQPNQLLTTSQTLTLHEEHEHPLFKEIDTVEGNAFSEQWEMDGEVFAAQPNEISSPKSKITSTTGGIPGEVNPAEGTAIQGDDMKSSQPVQTIQWDNKASGATSLLSSQLPSASQTLIEDAGFQVAQSFRDAIQLRNSDFEIKLTPEGLGQVHIRIHFDKKSVEANFTVEPSSLPYFQKHANAINAIFEANGFHSEQNGLTFSMHQGNTGQGSTHQGDPHQNQGTALFQTHTLSSTNNSSVPTNVQTALFNRQLNTHNPHGTFAVDI